VREFTTAIDSLAKMSVQPIQMSPIHIASVKVRIIGPARLRALL